MPGGGSEHVSLSVFPWVCDRSFSLDDVAERVQRSCAQRVEAEQYRLLTDSSAVKSLLSVVFVHALLMNSPHFSIHQSSLLSCITAL